MFSFLTVGLFTIAMYFVNSFERGLIVRLLAGLGSGAIFSAATTSILDHIPVKCRGFYAPGICSVTGEKLSFNGGKF